MYDFVIIGSGISGVYAAYLLSKQGLDNILILEANQRLGGRVYTHFFEKYGLHAEVGGEHINVEHERMIKLCEELELKLTDCTFRSSLLLNNSFFLEPDFFVRWQNKIKEWRSRLESEHETFYDPNFRQVTWWNFLQGEGFTDEEMEIIYIISSSDFGESLHCISAIDALGTYCYFTDPKQMKVEEGNVKILEKMSEKIGQEKILLEHPVKEIRQDKTDVLVETSSGKVFRAKNLICSLPASSVLKIKWQPSLSQAKLNALAGMHYSRVTKTIYLFKEKIWPRDDLNIYSDGLHHQIYYSTQNQSDKKGCLTGYSIGDKSHLASKLDFQESKEVLAKNLKPAFACADYIEDCFIYSWAKDTSSHGAYCLYRPNQWHETNAILSESINHNIHFVGEYLGKYYTGFMEGALESVENMLKKEKNLVLD